MGSGFDLGAGFITSPVQTTIYYGPFQVCKGCMVGTPIDSSRISGNLGAVVMRRRIAF